MKMFEYCSCERAGIKTEYILRFLKFFEEYDIPVHSILMARGRSVFLECNYPPFSSDKLHRMYSVSKSFVSMAVGLALTEGLFSLDDKIIDFFPEYRNENTDEMYDAVTIRDMLTMRSNIASFNPWWQIYDDRVRAYYDQKTAKAPGTLFYYDSMGSYLLGCIVEKLTGKTFLSYLKEKVLSKMGFSDESYTIYAPGKYTLGDSGVLCTPRDLLIFARFIMDGGVYDGVRYIDEIFMKNAVSKQVDCNIEGVFSKYKSHGYGYLIWKMPNDGFALVGMGGQLAVCDVAHDIIFVITADCQASDDVARELILDHLYNDIISNIEPQSLCENEKAKSVLAGFLASQKLVCQKGDPSSAISSSVSLKKYLLQKNPLGIECFSLYFEEEKGVLVYQKNGAKKHLEFGIGKNVLCDIPCDTKNTDVAGKTEQGSYCAACSGAWVSDNEFALKIQITDTYLGCLNVRFSFKGKCVCVCMKKSGQYILSGYEGYFIGKEEE